MQQREIVDEMVGSLFAKLSQGKATGSNGCVFHNQPILGGYRWGEFSSDSLSLSPLIRTHPQATVGAVKEQVASICKLNHSLVPTRG